MKFSILLILANAIGFCCWAQSEHVVSQELVGKWCYTSEASSTTDIPSYACVTLQADGSYDAAVDRSALPNGTIFPLSQDTDRGTWWVKDNRLFYNSESNGEGSFIFQKRNHPRNESIPLITVNGIMFAASSHAPW